MNEKTTGGKKGTRSRRGRQPATEETRNRIIDAAMELAVERPWTEITLAAIAEKAEITLAELHQHVSERDEILKLLARRVDEQVLASLEKEPLEGGAVDRLFELIMRRLEALAPWRPAIRNILKDMPFVIGEHPPLACQYLASQRWMLAAAGLERPGAEGAACALALGGIYLRALKTWVDDEDPGYSRTMARLDGDLKRAAEWRERLEGPVRAARTMARAGCAVLRGVAGLFVRPRRTRGEEGANGAAGAAEPAETAERPA
jgi:AcrR family transcriptional regulator